jgi:hypothetical protein
MVLPVAERLLLLVAREPFVFNNDEELPSPMGQQDIDSVRLSSYSPFRIYCRYFPMRLVVGKEAVKTAQEEVSLVMTSEGIQERGEERRVRCHFVMLSPDDAKDIEIRRLVSPFSEALFSHPIEVWRYLYEECSNFPSGGRWNFWKMREQFFNLSPSSSILSRLDLFRHDHWTDIRLTLIHSCNPGIRRVAPSDSSTGRLASLIM